MFHIFIVYDSFIGKIVAQDKINVNLVCFYLVCLSDDCSAFTPRSHMTLLKVMSDTARSKKQGYPRPWWHKVVSMLGLITIRHCCCVQCDNYSHSTSHHNIHHRGMDLSIYQFYFLKTVCVTRFCVCAGDTAARGVLRHNLYKQCSRCLHMYLPVRVNYAWSSIINCFRIINCFADLFITFYLCHNVQWISFESKNKVKCWVLN